MSNETGWLLERNNAQYYCAGVEEQHNGMGFCLFVRETKNHLEALRFARREDAEKFSQQIATFIRYTAVEHAWIGRAEPSGEKGKERVTDEVAFDRWFYGSKYMQVVSSIESRQPAFDGWNAALEAVADQLAGGGK